MEFNSLPLVAQLEIFAHLSVREVMKVRRVCKQWNRLINEVRFKRLSCYQMSSGGRSTLYEFNFSCIQSFLDYTSTDMKFSNVKSLNAFLYPNYPQLEDAFDFLNSFRSLEDLRFTCVMGYPWGINREEIKKKTLDVNLDRLRKAKFQFCWQLNWSEGNWEHSKVSVLLDLPSLLDLTISSWRGVTLKHPEKLRALAIHGLFKENADYSKFTSLSNIYTKGEDLRSISARFIESLPSLRELHLDYGYESNRPSVPPSNKATARIFYFGFEISLNQINLEDEQFPDSFPGSFQQTTEFIARNLHQSVDDNSFIKSINYNAMASALDDSEMFIVVPRKFPKINALYMHGAVADANRLLKFINHLSISYLEFGGSSLPQWFFEKLAANGSFIRKLHFNIERTMDIQSGDFDFIFKLKNLKSFYLDICSLPLNFVVRLLKERNQIGNFCFICPGTYCFSMILRDHMWEINLNIYRQRVGGDEVNDEEDEEEDEEDEEDEAIEELDNEANDLGPLSLTEKIPAKEILELMEALASRLKADGLVCPREFQKLFRLHQLEEQTGRFMICKYIYDHTHFICLTKEQMCQFR